MRLFLSGSILLVLSCSAGSESTDSNQAEITSSSVVSRSSAFCQTYPDAAVAQNRLTLSGSAKAGTFRLEFTYWLQDMEAEWSWDDPQRPVKPGSYEHYVLSEKMRCWTGHELTAHVLPVRRPDQPAQGTTVTPLVYCESPDEHAQLLFQREVTQKYSPEPVTSTEIVALFDSPTLAHAVPANRLTPIHTLSEHYTEHVVNLTEHRDYRTCTFKGSLEP